MHTVGCSSISMSIGIGRPCRTSIAIGMCDLSHCQICSGVTSPFFLGGGGVSFTYTSMKTFIVMKLTHGPFLLCRELTAIAAEEWGILLPNYSPRSLSIHHCNTMVPDLFA